MALAAITAPETSELMKYFPEARRFLRNYELITDEGQTVTSRTLADDEERLRVLDRIFGLPFPPGTRFRM